MFRVQASAFGTNQVLKPEILGNNFKQQTPFRGGPIERLVYFMQVTHSQMPTTLPVTTKALIHSKPPETSLQSSELPSDTVIIKKGILPTLKGGGLGLLTGAGGGIGVALAIDAASHMGSGALALMAIPLVGAPAGLVAGAVTANMTISKPKAALIGSGVGAVVGGVTSLVFSGGNIKLAMMGLGIGAAFGSVSGVAGASVAQVQK